MPGNQTWVEIRDRKIDENFEFQLQISRYYSVMNKTGLYTGRCKIQKPVPKYLVASPRTVHLYDKFRHSFETVFSSDSSSQGEVAFKPFTKISSFSYLMFRKELFWIDQNAPASVVRFKMESNKTDVMFYVREDADLMTIDYIQLILFWVQDNGRIIYMYDLLRNFTHDPGQGSRHIIEVHR